MNHSDRTFSNATPLCYSIYNPLKPFKLSIASVYHSATITTLGLVSNIIAFVVLMKSFYRVRNLSRSFFSIFLGSLVVTDFMGLLTTGSIVISFHVTNVSWRQLDPKCHFCNFMGMSMVFYGLCPLLLGAAMAVERFIGINCPFVHSSSMPKSRTTAMVLTVWFIAGTVSLLPLIGLGSYHLQVPGTWCFLNVSSKGNDMAFALIFSLTGLMCIAASFLLNTVSVVTLIKVCCGRNGALRRRDHEVEMMVQLILIMVIASACWCPFLIFIMQTVLSGHQLEIKKLLLWLRFASFNQVLDPWVYILFRRSVLQRVYPHIDWSQTSIISRYPSLQNTVRRLTRS